MQWDDISDLRGDINHINARISELEQLLRNHLNASEASRPVSHEIPPSIQRPPSSPVSVTVPPPQVSPAAPSRSRSDDSSLEEEIGGNWLNKIGAIALVLGIIFFLKYAIDNRWINETARIILGILAGLGCLYGGEYFQRKGLARYSHGLSGAGIAVLYATIFAAFSFYSLIEQIPAFAFMLVVTCTAIALSVRYDSIAIAIIGIVGGFLTPVLLQKPGSDGSSNFVQVLTYITIIDLGVLVLTVSKDWRPLNLLSFMGTVLFFAGTFNESHLGLTMAFLTIFFVIFAAQSLVQNVIVRRPLNPADVFMVLAVPVLYFATSYWLLSSRYHTYMGLFAVLMAGLYLALSYRVQVVGFEDKNLRLIFLGVAAAFLIIAIPIQLKQHWIVIGWSGEAAALAGIGFYLQSARTRYIAMLLLGISALYLLAISNMALTIPMLFFLNKRFLTFLFVIAMASLIAWLYQKNRGSITPAERSFSLILIVGANFLMIWALSTEALVWVWRISGNISNIASVESLTLSAVWAVYGIAMLIAGIIFRFRAARIMAIILLGVVVFKSFLIDVWALERIYRIFAFLGLGLVLLIASYVYQTHRDSIRQLVESDSLSESC